MRNRHRTASRSQNRRGEPRLLFTLVPVILAVLLVIGFGSVAAARTHWVTGSAAPASTTEVTNGLPVTSAAATTTTSTQSTTSAPTTSTTSTTSTTPPDNPAAAQAAVDAVDNEGSEDVQYGVAILDRDTGTVTLGDEGSTQFYCASVLKLFVVADLLHQQEIGALTLDSSAINDINRALSQSDDNAMDALWERFDGPQAITQMISLAHLQDTRLPSDLSQWGETLISPRDVIAVYQYVLTSLDQADQNLVLTDLNNATANGADGFDQSFGLLGSTRTSTTKAKQGWMIYGDQMMLHTTGVLGSDDQDVVALLSLQPTSIGWAAGRQNVDQATAAMLGALGTAATQ